MVFNYPPQVLVTSRKNMGSGILIQILDTINHRHNICDELSRHGQSGEFWPVFVI